MNKVPTEFLALQCLYHWEKTAPGRIALTQPMGGGVTQDYTWPRWLTQVPGCGHNGLDSGQ